MTCRARISAMIALLVIACVGVTPGLAHTDITDTDPASGGTLASAPSELVVTLSSPPGRVESARVFAEDRQVSGRPRLDPEDARRLIMPIMRPASGDHTAEWVLIAADGHRITGSTSFVVTPPQGWTDDLRELGLLIGAIGKELGETRAG